MLGPSNMHMHVAMHMPVAMHLPMHVHDGHVHGWWTQSEGKEGRCVEGRLELVQRQHQQ